MIKKNDQVIASHTHICPDCGVETAGYREINNCTDPKYRPCYKCLSKSFN